jgi:hypothetical protein
MFKKCTLCKNEFPEESLSKRRGWCSICKKEQVRLQKLKCYHANKTIKRSSYIKNKDPELHKLDYYKRPLIDVILESAKGRSKKSGLPFDLDKDFLIELLKNQNGKCAVTGIEFITELMPGCKRRPFYASLDRIDCNKGYIKTNVRFVCTIVNIAINEFGDLSFDKMCREYVKNTLCSS